jgi:hypothetical protein
MKELSASSQLPPTILNAVMEQTWKQIAVNDKLDLATFKCHISPIELHSALTVEFL